jgi:hypothetical protein
MSYTDDVLTRLFREYQSFSLVVGFLVLKTLSRLSSRRASRHAGMDVSIPDSIRGKDLIALNRT